MHYMVDSFQRLKTTKFESVETYIAGSKHSFFLKNLLFLKQLVLMSELTICRYFSNIVQLNYEYTKFDSEGPTHNYSPD